MQPTSLRASKADPALARQFNRATALSLIRERGLISRAEVASITGLAKNSVSSIFDALHRQGLIRSNGLAKASQRGGRRRELWSIDPDAGYVMAVDLERSRVEAALMSFDGQILAKHRSTPRDSSKRAAILRALRSVLDKLTQDERLNGGRVLGLGVATFGRLDASKSVANCYGLVPDWDNVPLKEIIEKHTGYEAILETNQAASAMAEQWFGAARNMRDFAVLLFRTGVGVGLCANGSILGGATGRAGEIGHMTVDEDGPRCACGSRGCLEAMASRAALIRRVEQAGRACRNSVLVSRGKPSTVTLDRIIQAANSGDSLARRLLGETASHVGVGLANLLCLMDPELIIIGPALSKAGPAIIAHIAKEIEKRIPGARERSIRVEASSLGDDLVLIGASTLVFAKALEGPIA